MNNPVSKVLTSIAVTFSHVQRKAEANGNHSPLDDIQGQTHCAYTSGAIINFRRLINTSKMLGIITTIITQKRPLDLLACCRSTLWRRSPRMPFGRLLRAVPRIGWTWAYSPVRSRTSTLDEPAVFIRFVLSATTLVMETSSSSPSSMSTTSECWRLPDFSGLNFTSGFIFTGVSFSFVARMRRTSSRASSGVRSSGSCCSSGSKGRLLMMPSISRSPGSC
jgi:hypothetical protein